MGMVAMREKGVQKERGGDGGSHKEI